MKYRAQAKYDFVSKWLSDDELKAHAQKVCEENDIPYVAVRFGFSVGVYEREV